MPIPNYIERKHILEAIQYVKNYGIPGHRESTKYVIEFEGNHYPPKYVISIAHKFCTGQELPPNRFYGGEQSNKFLIDRGFSIVYKLDSLSNIKPLIPYQDYSRKDVHDIFSPNTPFVPQAGTWGLQGIIRIPMRPKDYVFFVTFGSHQAHHTFDEGVTDTGILTWQSQPSGSLSDSMIQDFINHDHLINNIYLFLRTRKNVPYTYLGRLAYITHDRTREKPVYFKWQIIDWDLPPEKAEQMGLVLGVEDPAIQQLRPVSGLVEDISPSSQKKERSATDFTARHIDFAANEQRNKDVGKIGELLVVNYEKDFLIAAGRQDLSKKVVHTSTVEGDGAGYDIKSFYPDGKDKYIEVKSTSGGAGTPFYVSLREVYFSEEHSTNYELYRVYNLDIRNHTGKFFKLAGKLSDHFELLPIHYKAVKKD